MSRLRLNRSDWRDAQLVFCAKRFWTGKRMTLENRIVVGLDDIKAVTLECTDQDNKKCCARFSSSPDMIQIPKNCPQCNATWWKGDQTFRQYDNPRQMGFL